MGERTPHCDPNARAALVGLAASHGRGHIVRAIMEGVAFSLRDTLSIFSELGVPVEQRPAGRRRIAVGALAPDPGRRLRPCRRHRGADEGAAYGAAILAAVGIGLWPTVDAACDALVRGAAETMPQPEVVTRDERAIRRLPAPLSGAADSRRRSMTDRYAPRPEHKFSFGLWTVGNRGRDPFGDVVRDPLPPVDAVALLAEVGAWGVNLHDNDLVPIDASPADRDRIVERVQGGVQPARHRRADGHRQPVLRPGVSRRRLHRERPARARVCAGEDEAGDGPRRGAGRRHLRALGRTRRHRDRRVPPARRGDQAAAGSGERALRVFDRSPVRLQVRARGQAERAARRHLHGDDRRLSRIHPDARSSRDGRREPGSRARTDGRAELPPRGGAGVGSRQAVSHRSERPGARAGTTRTSVSDPPT